LKVADVDLTNMRAKQGGIGAKRAIACSLLSRETSRGGEFTKRVWQVQRSQPNPTQKKKKLRNSLKWHREKDNLSETMGEVEEGSVNKGKRWRTGK